MKMMKEVTMDNIRKIRKIIIGRPMMEGAGVHLTRVFGSYFQISIQCIR
jgi:redox-sensitive bicupin YhaK (pirin superfamily)